MWGVFVREHAKAVRLYDDVAVLHGAGVDPNLQRLWRVEQETDESFTEGLPTYRVWHQPPPIPQARYLLYLWSIFQAFRHIAAQGFYPDVLHAHVYSAGFPAALLGKLYRLPVVITEHVSTFSRKLLSRCEVLTAHLAFRWSTLVMPVSPTLQKAIEDHGICARFQVVPNAVDTTLFTPFLHNAPEHNAKRLLFVGSLVPVKGIPYLLQALAQLRRKREDWHLDIAGDGSARAEYECLAIELGIADQVTFTGIKSRREVAALMQRADLFVLPSLCETFATVAAEALAAGTPVLATRCGGPEEFITEQVGMLVPPGDADALCEGLDTMLDQLSRYDPYRVSRYAVERFSLERVGQQLHMIYKILFAQKR